MSNPMDYRGKYRKFVEGTSNYVVYYYGDVVERNGVSYVCNLKSTQGYAPEEPNSGFVIIGDGVGGGTAAPSDLLDGGSYTT